MIDLTKNEEKIKQNIQHCRERKIKLPTFLQMQNPDLIPDEIKDNLKKISLWETDPNNLFRITWKNEPVSKGGGFGNVNYMVVPSELSGVRANIIALIGKWFPTGAHKVGATYGCLIPALTTGQFSPSETKAVWPSTGNYCRGGAYVSSLMGCDSIAILPENMSRERFDWLKNIAGEIITTPGSESNVKEIFDKCIELKNTRDDILIFNQFEEFGNLLWHYMVTGPAAEEALRMEMGPNSRLAGGVCASGSAGSMAFAYYLKNKFPKSRLAVSEALQCPTLLNNGFGDHRIEGIGDKHVPWIHNVKNTDMVIAVDDETAMSVSRLFNEPDGINYLAKQGVESELLEKLPLAGISGVSNIIAAIKFAKWYELGAEDVVMTVLTDSMELYNSRLVELNETRGEFSEMDAHLVYGRDVVGVSTDYMTELDYYGRKRIHNLKYFTWVEQQGKSYDEIQAQWYQDSYWHNIRQCVEPLDALIADFNRMSGASIS